MGSATRFTWLRAVSACAAVTWMALISYLSSQPVLPTPALFPGQDKIFHAGFFGILGIFYLLALGNPRSGFTEKQVLVAATGVLLYGISDELHQYYVPGRSADVMDVLADFGGGLLATAGLARIRNRA